jgi:hypothetical protein
VEPANQATFTELEMEAYREVMDETQQARDYGEAQHAKGVAEGEARGKAAAMVAVLAARAIPVRSEIQERTAACTDGAVR